MSKRDAGKDDAGDGAAGTAAGSSGGLLCACNNARAGRRARSIESRRSVPVADARAATPLNAWSSSSSPERYLPYSWAAPRATTTALTAAAAAASGAAGRTS